MSGTTKQARPGIGTLAIVCLVFGAVTAHAGEKKDAAFGIFGEAGLTPTAVAGPEIVAGTRLIAVLENHDDGHAAVWTNVDTGTTYRIRPERSFTSITSTCRTFTVRRISNRSVVESYRTACRGADGSWHVTIAGQPVHAVE